MNKQNLNTFFGFFVVPVSFFIVTLLLTYNILDLSSLVIGDNFYWNKANITDILGLSVVRASYMGDVAMLSTFKNGFMFPLTCVFSELNLPVTVIYPFLFYFLSMLSFYALSTEFLRSKVLRIIVSTIYVVNPVTPYYFASILSAFALIFLPLTLKFFFKSLIEINSAGEKSHLLKNILLGAFFLSLSVSAHEQFFLSSALVGAYIISTFTIVCFRKLGRSRHFVRISLLHMLAFMSMFVIINMPLVLSFYNIRSSPTTTYYTGRFNDFLDNVQYSYSKANLVTLLRLGGDSGAGLGTDSWYDSNLYTNLFGYAIFIMFAASVLILAVRKDIGFIERAFFYMNVLMFFNSIFLMEFMKSLPNNRILSERLFNFVLQTWEGPGKLRAVLLLSSLTTTLVFFRKLENYSQTRQRKVVKGTVVSLIILSIVIYNSPWLIGYGGYTPLQQVADSLEWGKLFEDNYSKLAGFLHESYDHERGLIIPYTHKAELYVPPNFRLLQLVSPVKDQATRLTEEAPVAWSELLDLFSVRYLVINNEYREHEELIIFPKPISKNITLILEELENDIDLEFRESLGYYTILENQDALPIVYATEYFVFYDNIGTLKYALQFLDFKDLPVFLGSEEKINEFSLPEFVHEDTYEVNALCPSGDNKVSSLNLVVANDYKSDEIVLNRVSSMNGVDRFSASYNLSPSDTVRVPDSEFRDEDQQIDQLVLNSTTQSLGNYQSFTLNFTVNILERGPNSFLAPRVVIDVERVMYFIIFHDNGFVELAILQDGEWGSNQSVCYTGYKLEGKSDAIDVSVRRIFDNILVYVGGKFVMSFPIGTATSNLSLSSEQSTSQFANIYIKAENILKLFAARRVSGQLSFSLQQEAPNESVLVVSNVTSDYAVVHQYLYTQLRSLETDASYNAVRANVFFKGWIVQADESDSQQMTVAIVTRNSLMTIGLTLFSIFFAYSILVLEVLSACRKVPVIFSRLIDKLTRVFLREKTKPDV